MINLAVLNCGMVTNVGHLAPASCAAIRCGLNNFVETRFVDSKGEWIIGSEVALEKPWRGRSKLAQFAAMAIDECWSILNPESRTETPVVLCLSENERPGRIEGQDEYLLREIETVLGCKLHPDSIIISNGSVGGVQAIEKSHRLIRNSGHKQCVVAACDTYLTAATISSYEKAGRILTEDNSDGFIPGEAGAAVLLGSSGQADQAHIIIGGIGFGREISTIESSQPFRADGLVQAVKGALGMASRELGDLDFRICGISGEQYYFKEAALAMIRTLRRRKDEFDIWHPAECIGETGAATVPVVLSVASAAVRKGYSKGDGILCHFANDDGQRAAIVVNAANSGRVSNG